MFAIHPKRMVGNQVCIKEKIGDYEISISFDDSCGVLFNCSRGDIRIFSPTDDVTHLYLKKIGLDENTGVIPATLSNLCQVYEFVNGLNDFVEYMSEKRPCDFCGKEFTQKEWEERHMPHERDCPFVGDTIGDCDCDCDLVAHPCCCPDCGA